MYVHMCHTTHSVYISIEKSEGCCEECVFAVQGYSVYVFCVTLSMRYMQCMSVGLGRKEES